MPRIAVLGGTGYLASIIKNQNVNKKLKYTFFSRNKKSKNFINYLNFENKEKILKGFDIIIHLVGPNNKQITKKLLKEKNKITTNICNICIKNNIKLIYISSMQVYKNYGMDKILLNSKINQNNLYSKSHYSSEKIILKKFKKLKNMFIILRLGNVFGFKKYENFNVISQNLIHNLCFLALNNKKILIKNGDLQRSFVPSNIFIKVINNIIEKNYFKNLIINIFYKNYSIANIAKLIQKRFKLMSDIKVNLKIANHDKTTINKKIFVYTNKHFSFYPINKIINSEIDQILKKIKV